MISFGCLHFHIQQCGVSFTSYIKCGHLIQKCKYHMKHFTMELEIIISFILCFAVSQKKKKKLYTLLLPTKLKISLEK